MEDAPVTVPFPDINCLNTDLTYGSVSDIDGNVYATIQIGSQTWMAQNLKTSRYSNGDSIRKAVSSVDWLATSTAAYTVYDNLPVNDFIYGKLYNWAAVSDPRNICPYGWHVPTDLEWQVLEAELGMPLSQLDSVGIRGVTQQIGVKLKSAVLWDNPGTGNSNMTGFSAIPGGWRNYCCFAYFSLLGHVGNFWSATALPSSDRSWSRYLNGPVKGIYRQWRQQKYGLCVRCLMD